MPKRIRKVVLEELSIGPQQAFQLIWTLEKEFPHHEPGDLRAGLVKVLDELQGEGRLAENKPLRGYLTLLPPSHERSHAVGDGSYKPAHVSREPEAPVGIGAAVHATFLKKAREQDGWFKAGALGSKYDRTTRSKWLASMVKVGFLESNAKKGNAREYRVRSARR